MADLPSMPAPNVPFVNQTTGLVDSLWYAWLKQFLQALKELGIAFDGLSDDVAGLSLSDTWQHTVPTAQNGTFVMIQKATFAGTITSTTTDCDSGTCTFRAQIDGVNVGASNNSVSTTESEVTHSTSNAFTAGQTIQYVITSASACQQPRFQINYTRSLA